MIRWPAYVGWRIMQVGFITIVVLPVLANPAFACTGINIKTNKAQTVRQVFTSKSHPQRYIAAASFDPATGRPLITYYRRYSRLPGYYKSFVRHHECCHHIHRRRGQGFGDEIGANCCALRRMRVSKSLARKIKGYMIRQNINSDVAINSPGVGADFWVRTYSRCPGSARVK